MRVRCAAALPAGIPYSTLPPSSGISWTVESFRDMQLQQGIGAVVVGFDEDFSYEKLCFASACLREIPDCHFVCTNLDNADHIGEGRGGAGAADLPYAPD